MQFKELSTKAKETAYEQIRWHHSEFLWEVHELTDEFKWVLDRVGFPTDRISWSLGHCQGDGVAFYGHVDLQKYLRWKQPFGTRPDRYYDSDEGFPADFNIENWSSHMYHHWNSMTITYEDQYTDDTFLEECREIRDMLDEDTKAMSRALEKYGYNWIESSTCDEAVEDMLLHNPDIFEFDEWGKLVA